MLFRSCYFHIGSGDKVERYLHNPHYDMDEKCLETGLSCFLAMYNRLAYEEN